MEVDLEHSLSLENTHPGEMEEMEIDDQKEEPKKVVKHATVLNDDNPTPSKRRKLSDTHSKEIIAESTNMESGGGNQLSKTDCPETAGPSSILKIGEDRREHQGENPFECSLSENTVSQPPEVRLHEQFHPKPVVQCSECGEKFVRKTSWIWHYVTHLRKDEDEIK